MAFLQYCEYMPDVTKCRQWLEKNFPDEFAKLTVGKSLFYFLTDMCPWTYLEISCPVLISFLFLLYLVKINVLDAVK